MNKFLAQVRFASVKGTTFLQTYPVPFPPPTLTSRPVLPKNSMSKFLSCPLMPRFSSNNSLNLPAKASLASSSSTPAPPPGAPSPAPPPLPTPAALVLLVKVEAVATGLRQPAPIPGPEGGGGDGTPNTPPPAGPPTAAPGFDNKISVADCNDDDDGRIGDEANDEELFFTEGDPDDDSVVPAITAAIPPSPAPPTAPGTTDEAETTPAAPAAAVAAANAAAAAFDFAFSAVEGGVGVPGTAATVPVMMPVGRAEAAETAADLDDEVTCGEGSGVCFRRRRGTFEWSLRCR